MRNFMRQIIASLLLFVLPINAFATGGVVNGQQVNSTITNNAFLFKNANDTEPFTITWNKESINKQITTPSDPASGYNKSYFKSDNNFYIEDSSGNETKVSNAAINQLTGDVLAGPGFGSQVATVALVGGQSSGSVATATVLANTATNLNTASTIVKRDSSGNFSAGTISAATFTGSAASTLNSLSITNGQSVGTSLTLNGSLLLAQTTDSTTTGASVALSVSNPTTALTNASLTSIGSIASPVTGQVITLINKTGASITIRNEYTSATAVNRILTGSGSDLTLTTDASVIVNYNSQDTRWHVVGGSGSGGLNAKGVSDVGYSSISNVQVPSYQLTTAGTGTGLIETANGNILRNQNFQGTNASDNWTVSNSTASTDTTSFVTGTKQSLKLTLSAQSGIILNQSVTPPTGMEVSGNWEYNVTLKTALTGVSVCPVQNAIEITTSCVSVSSDGAYHSYPINYPASSIANGIDVKVASSSTGTVNIGAAYVGPARNIGSTNSPDTFAYANNIAGGAYTSGTTFPFTNVIVDTVGGFSAGAYTVKVASTCTASASIYSNTSSADSILLKKNGTTIGSGYGTQSATAPQSLHITPVTFTAAINDVITVTKSVSVTLDASNTEYWVSIRCTPSSSQQVQSIATVSASWAGTSTLSGSTTTTGSFVDPASVTGTVTAGPSKSITCTAASSLVGISCTLPALDNYQVCYTGYIADSATPQNVQVKLIDSSAVVAVGLQRADIAYANATSSVGGCSNYLATSTTPTFKLQEQISGGTGTVNLTGFSIVRTGQGIPAVVGIGSVTSNSAGADAVAYALSPTACTSTPCTITTQSGVNSVTRNSVGNYTLNITPGVFSSTPGCTCSSTGSVCGDFTFTSATSINFITLNSSFASTDGGFFISCIGHR